MDEEEYYKEEERVHTATTHSGRKVYSVPRLIVPIPDNDDDLADLKKFDDAHGEDCLDGLSDSSNRGSDDEDGEGDYTKMEDSEDDDESSDDDSSSIGGEECSETDDEIEDAKGVDECKSDESDVGSSEEDEESSSDG